MKNKKKYAQNMAKRVFFNYFKKWDGLAQSTRMLPNENSF